MARGIGGDHGAAQLAGVERGNLLVDRADLRAFLVGKHRQVDRARQVILGKFQGERVSITVSNPASTGSDSDVSRMSNQ